MTKKSKKLKEKTMFFEFKQNNPGGSFMFDKAGITHYVIIEAENADDANYKAEGIGIYFDGREKEMDCDCCGDRWYPVSGKGTETPTVYGKSVESAAKALDLMRWMKEKGPEIYVHYLDGTIKGFYND